MDIRPYRKPGSKLYDFPSAFYQQGKTSVWLCGYCLSANFLAWHALSYSRNLLLALTRWSSRDTQGWIIISTDSPLFIAVKPFTMQWVCCGCLGNVLRVSGGWLEVSVRCLKGILKVSDGCLLGIKMIYNCWFTYIMKRLSFIVGNQQLYIIS